MTYPSSLPAAGYAGAVPAVDHERIEREQEIIALDAEVGVLDIREPAELTAEALAQIDRMMYKARELHAEIAKLNAVRDARIADIERWAAQQTGRMHRQIDYLMMVLEHAAANTVFKGKTKSITLPNGVLGRRQQQPAITVTDPDAALQFSKANGIEYKQGKDEPYVGKLKEWMTGPGQGVVPEGCEVNTYPDKPYAKVDPLPTK